MAGHPSASSASASSFAQLSRAEVIALLSNPRTQPKIRRCDPRMQNDILMEWQSERKPYEQVFGPDVLFGRHFLELTEYKLGKLITTGSDVYDKTVARDLFSYFQGLRTIHDGAGSVPTQQQQGTAFTSAEPADLPCSFDPQNSPKWISQSADFDLENMNDHALLMQIRKCFVGILNSERGYGIIAFQLSIAQDASDWMDRLATKLCGDKATSTFDNLRFGSGSSPAEVQFHYLGSRKARIYVSRPTPQRDRIYGYLNDPRNIPQVRLGTEAVEITFRSLIECLAAAPWTRQSCRVELQQPPQQLQSFQMGDIWTEGLALQSSHQASLKSLTSECKGVRWFEQLGQSKNIEAWCSNEMLDHIKAYLPCLATKSTVVEFLFGVDDVSRTASGCLISEAFSNDLCRDIKKLYNLAFPVLLCSLEINFIPLSYDVDHEWCAVPFSLLAKDLTSVVVKTAALFEMKGVQYLASSDMNFVTIAKSRQNPQIMVNIKPQSNWSKSHVIQLIIRPVRPFAFSLPPTILLKEQLLVPIWQPSHDSSRKSTLFSLSSSDCWLLSRYLQGVGVSSLQKRLVSSSAMNVMILQHSFPNLSDASLPMFGKVVTYPTIPHLHQTKLVSPVIWIYVYIDQPLANSEFLDFLEGLRQNTFRQFICCFVVITSLFTSDNVLPLISLHPVDYIWVPNVSQLVEQLEKAAATSIPRITPGLSGFLTVSTLGLDPNMSSAITLAEFLRGDASWIPWQDLDRLSIARQEESVILEWLSSLTSDSIARFVQLFGIRGATTLLRRVAWRLAQSNAFHVIWLCSHDQESLITHLKTSCRVMLHQRLIIFCERLNIDDLFNSVTRLSRKNWKSVLFVVNEEFDPIQNPITKHKGHHHHHHSNHAHSFFIREVFMPADRQSLAELCQKSGMDQAFYSWLSVPPVKSIPILLVVLKFRQLFGLSPKGLETESRVVDYINNAMKFLHDAQIATIRLLAMLSYMLDGRKKAKIPITYFNPEIQSPAFATIVNVDNGWVELADAKLCFYILMQQNAFTQPNKGLLSWRESVFDQFSKLVSDYLFSKSTSHEVRDDTLTLILHKEHGQARWFQHTMHFVQPLLEKASVAGTKESQAQALMLLSARLVGLNDLSGALDLADQAYRRISSFPTKHAFAVRLSHSAVETSHRDRSSALEYFMRFCIFRSS